MGQIPGKMIKDTSIAGTKLENGAVDTTQLANDAVTELKIATSVAGNGLTGGGGSPLAVGDGAGSAISVTADAIAVSTDDVTIEDDGGTPGSLRVKDGGITEAKIGAGAVTETKIGTGAVTEAKIGTGAVTTAKIGNDQVTNAKIAPQAVDTTELALDAVDNTILDLAGTYDFDSGGGEIYVGTPTAGTHAANKDYVDSVAQGLDVKDSVRAMSASNVTISGLQTIDGISLADADRVLLTGQTNPVENGLWLVKSAGAWARPTDFLAGSSAAGAFTFVEEGTSYHDTGWVCTSDQGYDIVGTDTLEWAQFSGAGSIVAGNGLDKSGSTIFITELANSGIDVQTTGVAVNVDNSTVEIAAGTPGTVRVKNAGITENHLNTSVAGNGLTGGGGSPLAVGNLNDSVSISASGIKSAVNTKVDKEQTASVTTGDGQTTGASITYTPGGNCHVMVMVNGVQMVVGDGVKTKDCYFSADGGTTARVIQDISASDVLYWNGSVAGFQLDTNDKIDLNYATTS